MNMQDFWKNKQVPEIAGDICFADGRVVVFENSECCNGFSYRIHHIDSFDVNGCDVDIINECIVKGRKGTLYYGGGSMGNEGYLIYTDNNDLLIWCMSLSFSNPFVSARFTEDEKNIIALTEIDYEFFIPIENPEYMTCISHNPWGY